MDLSKLDLSKLDLSKIPALTPPPGVTPNFENPENFFGTIIGTIVVCLTLTTFLAWTRIYTRLFITKSISWDDYAYFIGWLGLIGYCVIGAVGMQYGNGVHQWDVNIPDAINFGKLANTQEVYYTLLIFMTKLAILLQYLRIFVPNKQSKTYYFTQSLIWANFVLYVVLGFCAAFMCSPRDRIWNPLVPGKCLSLAGILIAGGVINIFSDFCVLTLPLASIWQLQMATRHKIGISAVFAVGLFACVSSIMRLVTSIEAIRSKDYTWDLVRTYLWTVAEITSGVVCGSLPILPQFMRTFVPKLTSIFASNSNRKGTLSQGTPSNRIYHAESRNTPKKAGSGAWHDLRDMNPKSPYVELDQSDTRSDRAVLAPREAAAPAPEETNKADTPGTPPEKGGGEVWDGPVVHQTDLESGSSVSNWQSKRGAH